MIKLLPILLTHRAAYSYFIIVISLKVCRIGFISMPVSRSNFLLNVHSKL